MALAASVVLNQSNRRHFYSRRLIDQLLVSTVYFLSFFDDFRESEFLHLLGQLLPAWKNHVNPTGRPIRVLLNLFLP